MSTISKHDCHEGNLCRFRIIRQIVLRLVWMELKVKIPVVRTGIFVSDTGIEPATSSVSGKRATAAPIAHALNLVAYFLVEVETGFEPVGLQLCRLLLWAAQPLHHAATGLYARCERMTRFELATPTLARLCSTTEPHPHAFFRRLEYSNRNKPRPQTASGRVLLLTLSLPRPAWVSARVSHLAVHR